jgi:hypothetical protein
VEVIKWLEDKTNNKTQALKRMLRKFVNKTKLLLKASKLSLLKKRTLRKFANETSKPSSKSNSANSNVFNENSQKAFKGVVERDHSFLELVFRELPDIGAGSDT